MPRQVWISSVVIVVALVLLRYALMNFEDTDPTSGRVRSDLRSLMAGLVDLQTEYEIGVREGRTFSYQPPFWNEGFKFGPLGEMYPVLLESMEYPSEPPKDRFSNASDDYLVAASGPVVILMSVGPNGVLDISQNALRGLMETESDRLDGRIHPFMYSATNGVQSTGDIFRIEHAMNPKDPHINLPKRGTSVRLPSGDQ